MRYEGSEVVEEHDLNHEAKRVQESETKSISMDFKEIRLSGHKGKSNSV